MMQDGKEIYFKRDFPLHRNEVAEAFDIRYLNTDNEHVYAPHQLLQIPLVSGAMIMTHGDDKERSCHQRDCSGSLHV